MQAKLLNILFYTAKRNCYNPFGPDRKNFLLKNYVIITSFFQQYIKLFD